MSDDILGTLFGGSESKASGDLTPGEFQRLREPLSRTVEKLLGQRKGDPLKGIPQYQGETTAPLTPAEQEILAQLQGATGPGTARAQLLDKTLSGEFADPASNPFLQAYIEAAQRPTIQALEDTLSRTLPGQFTQAGQFTQPGGSSPFAMAAARAYEASANAAADIASQIGFGAYESERGRQQEAIGLSQDEVKTSIANLQAQELPRLIEQHGLELGLQEFQRRTQALLQLLQIMTGATAPTYVSESQSQPGILAPIAGATGTALAGSGG